MNVFVLCAGRCGSVTLSKALGHATNYTVGHESRWGMLGDARFDYPPDHIEIDNRLSWMLGRLGIYFDEARYIHLMRDRDECAESFTKRVRGILDAYHNGIACAHEAADRLAVARDLVDNVNENIREFVRHRYKRVRTVALSELPDRLPELWTWLGCEGDLDAAMAEFAVKHNASV